MLPIDVDGAGTEVEPFEKLVMVPGVGRGETEDAPEAEMSGVASAGTPGDSRSIDSGGESAADSSWRSLPCTSADVISDECEDDEEVGVVEENCWRYAAATVDVDFAVRRALLLVNRLFFVGTNVVVGASLRLKGFRSIRKLTGVCNGEGRLEGFRDGLGRSATHQGGDFV